MNIDEIELRINHYFKMQESIKGGLGYSMLTIGILKTFFAFWFCFSQKTRHYEISGHPDQVLAFVEVGCIFNLVLAATVYVVVKLSWQVVQAACPITHMKLRQKKSMCKRDSAKRKP